MDDEYDVVICGTGLKECILSGLLSVHGKKVLHVDRNSYYGGDSASLNLNNLYEKFRPGNKPPEKYGFNANWNVDLIPKFIMRCGKLSTILRLTNVYKNLYWIKVSGSYIYQSIKPNIFNLFSRKDIHKVPSNEREALSSPLMGLLQKSKCRDFFKFCIQWISDDTSTHQGFDPEKTLMSEVYSRFGLDSNTIDFIGHAVALYTNDQYINKPMGKTMEKIHLYLVSFAVDGGSPFIYPLYGLGGLPEAFSRLSAVYGGTYMLNQPVESFVYDENSKVCGVKNTLGEVAKCKLVVCDPSYVLGDTKKLELVGKIIRCICILGAPIPETNNDPACQIIMRKSQLNRNNDIYIMLISSSHGVALDGKYIAVISTSIETNDPESEIIPALDLLGDIEEKFIQITDEYKAADDGKKDNVYVSDSYDATSHFEKTTNNVLKLWENITGKPLDLNCVLTPSNDS